ncbi:MAG: T9SS type A sorting domain-containing protein [Bacteroidota bacterium]
MQFKKLTHSPTLFLLILLTSPFTFLFSQNCNLPSTCPSDVAIFQCTSSFPSTVNKAFSCEQYVNCALENGQLTGHYPLSISSSGPNPNNYSFTDPPSIHRGFITIENNATTRSRSDLIHFQSDHWAYRIYNSSGPKWISKIGPFSHLDILTHGTNLNCQGFGVQDDVYAWVGDNISVSNAVSFNGTTITVNAGTTFNPSLLFHQDVIYNWFDYSNYILIYSSTSSTASVVVPSNTPHNHTTTLKVRYRGKNMPGNSSREQLYTIKVINNSNPCNIVGDYTYSGGGTYSLNSWNSTGAYATTISIDDCSGQTISWTKTGGSGWVYSGGSGHTASVYLNSGQTINLQASAGSTSRSITFTRSGGGGGWKVGGEASFTAFPNPTNGKCFVVVPEAMRGQNMELFDLAGRKLMTQRAEKHQEELDLQALPKGLYILRLGSESLRITRQ